METIIVFERGGKAATAAIDIETRRKSFLVEVPADPENEQPASTREEQESDEVVIEREALAVTHGPWFAIDQADAPTQHPMFWVVDFETETISIDSDAEHAHYARAAAVEIEQAVETRRDELSSPLSAKRDHYLQKATLARQALTDVDALAMFESEALARGVTAEQLRDVVLATAAQWQMADQALAALEAAGKAALAMAAVDEIDNTLQQYLVNIKAVGA